jgi:hypothetical protein
LAARLHIISIRATPAILTRDATGRRSPLSGMLAAIGARRPDEEKEDCGFVYYARHFRSAGGSCPEARERLLQHFEGVSILTLPCDNGTWGVPFVTSARDKELRALRAVPAWEAAKVISLGSTAPRYPGPGPGRAELLAAVVPSS